MTSISPPPEIIIRSARHSSTISQEFAPPRESFNGRLHYIPLALSLFFPVAFVGCYFIALSMGHINAFFAFISDTGTLPPEQNVFAQLVNVGSALFAYFVYIRYVQVDQYMKQRFNKATTISNVISLAFGFVSSLGMSLVGNFPELVIKEVHLVGAFLAFVGGSIYSLFQGYFSFKMLPHFPSKCIAYMRTFLGILGLMLYFGAQSTIVVAFSKVKNKEKLENSNPEALKWNEDDGGYNYRAASVIMEWFLLGIFDLFIASFVSEFKRFKLAEPNVTFIMDVTTVPASVVVKYVSDILGNGDGDLDSVLRDDDEEGPNSSRFQLRADNYAIVEENATIPPSRVGSERVKKVAHKKLVYDSRLDNFSVK